MTNIQTVSRVALTLISVSSAAGLKHYDEVPWGPAFLETPLKYGVACAQNGPLVDFGVSSQILLLKYPDLPWSDSCRPKCCAWLGAPSWTFSSRVDASATSPANFFLPHFETSLELTYIDDFSISESLQFLYYSNTAWRENPFCFYSCSFDFRCLNPCKQSPSAKIASQFPDDLSIEHPISSIFRNFFSSKIATHDIFLVKFLTFSWTKNQRDDFFPGQRGGGSGH